MKNKRVIFVTGTRADYGKMEPLALSLIAIGFTVDFFITGMHLLEKYGKTSIEVKRTSGAGFFEFINQRDGDPLDVVLAKTVLGFSDFILEYKPDLVIIHGDRIEALAASLVCASNNIRSAHIEGGEVSGTIDESLRHCNSKLCTAHFVSSESAAARVARLGEPSERIFCIGSPELDVHLKSSGVSIEEVKARYEIKFSDYGIVAYHPVTTEIDIIQSTVDSMFNALKKSKKNFVVIGPNNDPGSEIIWREISKLPEDRFRVLPSMRFVYFSELMKNASIMIGNSSAGVREMPFLGRVSVNVGSRQSDRAQSNLVVSVDGLDSMEIERVVIDNWGKLLDRSTSFGDGGACKKFVEIVSGEKFWKLNLQKKFI